MKSIVKKLFSLMLILVVVLACGCSCKDDPEPTPVFPKDKDDVVYMTVKQGELTYDIYKNDMYINMKNTFGTGIIVDWADDLILKTVSKKELYNSLFGKNEKFDTYSTTCYWDRVKEEDIVALIDKNMYPNGKEGLTESELKEQKDAFYENFFVYGYYTEEQVHDYFHMKLAKLEVAKDYQEIYRSSIDFEPSQYQNSYTGSYYNEFYMILVPFTSSSAYLETLKNMGISVQNGTSVTSRWIWSDTSTPLTVNEVIEAYIDIYEKSGLFKDSSSENSKLVNGVDYTIEDSKYVFNTENKDGKLFYSANSMKYINSDLYKLLSNEFEAYSTSSTNESNAWYWANGYEFDGVYYTCLLLKKIDKLPYEEAKPIIRETLLTKELDDEFAESTMLTLRQVFGLMIYDVFLQTGYVNTYGSGSIPEVDVDNGNVVVTFKDSLLTKDDLFNLLEKRFGAISACELVNYYNALYDKEINDVYDLTKEDPSERILNKERWEYAWQTAELEKSDFEAGTYLRYGYPVSYGWENFLEAIYNVRSTQELAYHYLRENCLYDYLVKKYNINLYGENSLLWSRISAKMEEVVKEEHYSSSTVVNLYILDENGNRVETSKYTDNQKVLIKEFYGKIIDLLDKDSENYLETINSIVEGYNLSGFIIRGNESVEYLGMDLSLYKTNGIKISVETLSAVAYEDMDPSLGEVAKKIWEENVPSTDVIVYGKNETGYDYIEGEKAYFIYVNTSNIAPENIEGRNVPTFDECAAYLKAYLERSDDSGLTSEEESLVLSVYFPIYREQIGVYATALMFYNAQANYEFTFKLASFDINTYRKVLNVNIKDCTELLEYNLTY